MSDELVLERWTAPLIAKLSPSSRRSLMRKIAVEVRREQSDRIKAQRAPDGTAYTPRKSSGKNKKNKPVRFLYKKPAASKAREVEMVSYQNRGNYMVGYDREAQGLRTFKRDRIEKWLPTDHIKASAAIQQGSIKRKAMFAKMRTARFMKTATSANGAAVEFVGRDAMIASVHQYGLDDYVSKMNKLRVKYPARPLLGVSLKTRAIVDAAVIDHLGL